MQALPLYITKYVSWCFPVCLLQSVLANLLLQASFPFSSGYVTRWHPASTPPGPVTLNVNTCLFPPQVQWHSRCFEVRPCQQALSCTPFLFICGAKAAHTWDFFTSGKARAWSSFVLLAYRKRFFYCLTLIVYKMVKVRLQRPSIKHHQLRIWLVKNRKSTRVWTHGGQQ